MVDRYGFIDAASGYEPLYFGKTTDLAPHAISGPEYVLHSDFAELAAENEWLKQAIADANADRDRWYESSFRATTGAVTTTDNWKRDFAKWMKATPGQISLYQAYHAGRSALVSHQRAINTVDAHETANVSDKPEIGKCGNCGTPDWEKGDMPTCDDSYCTFPYWEATKPEGQQEPVAWLIGGVVWTRDREKAEDAQSRGATIEPVYTRPSEQAVTEEMVKAAYAELLFGIPDEAVGVINRDPNLTFDGIVRRVLKAAMEAGG